MANDSKDPMHALALKTSDAQLAQVDFAKYYVACADSALNATVDKLNSMGHKAEVVETKEAAVALLSQMLQGEVSSVSCGGSRTLDEIGFSDVLKGFTKPGFTNYKGSAVAAMSKGDMAGYSHHLRLGNTADIFFSSVCAVAQTGEIIGCDASGSRVGAWCHGAKKLILVCGANKVVPTYEDAVKRMNEFQLPLESARARIAYKVPGSATNNIVVLKTPNPWAPGRVHVVFVKGVWGY